MRNLRTVIFLVFAAFIFAGSANGSTKTRAAGVGAVQIVAGAGATDMQAVTVPANGADPSAPHRIISGRVTTLKGIARGGANQYMWDFGDGTNATLWLPISNPYTLGISHTYNGAVGQSFTATLSVRSSSDTSVVKSATYPVQIASGSSMSTPSDLDVMREVAIDEALWYLHANQFRGTFDAGAPGYGQGYGNWNDSIAGVCGAVDAFEVAGHTASANFDVDPYVETVVRGLNFMLSGATSRFIDPSSDGNGNGVGVYFSASDETGENAICTKALADSRASSMVAPVGFNGVFGLSFGALTQDAADWFAYGSNDNGGWGAQSNTTPSETTFSGDVILALMSAKKNMGATVPSFVQTTTETFFNSTRHVATSSTDLNAGGWHLRGTTGLVTPAQTAAGILALEFLGAPRSDVRYDAAVGFLFRHWNDRSGCTDVNLSNAYAMNAIKQALSNASPSITRVNEFDFATTSLTANSFDWYYTLAGQTQQGIANNLITRQFADGSWMDMAGCTSTPTREVVGTPSQTAFGSIILTGNLVAAAPPQQPHAEICDCGSKTAPANSDLTLSGSCSTHPDSSRSIVKYEWDFNYNSTSGFNTQTTGQQVTKVGGYPAAGTYAVALRVTDDNPTSLGGPQSSLFVCNVVITAVVLKAPTVKITQSPNGSNGWFTTSTATAHVEATDNGSGAKNLACTVDGNATTLNNGNVVISTEGDHVLVCSATDTSGSLSDSATAHVKLDHTKPVISGSASPVANAAGWNRTAVTVSFTCTDRGGSGLATSNVAGRTLATDGEAQSVTNTGSCADNAGNAADAATVSGINIDSTGPVITFTGNASPYSIDQKINITCAATDATSGIASTTCADVHVSALTAGVGSHTLSASATDHAGNTSTASTTYVVKVPTQADICNLIKQYVESSAKYQSRQNQGHDFCSNACEKLNDIVTAANATAKAGKLTAFENMIHAAVNAEWLTEDQANTVIALARTL